MDKAALIKLAITGAALFAAYRFAPSPVIKTAVLGIAGVVVVKNTPFVNKYVAV